MQQMSERTLKLIEGYPVWHAEGFSVREISEMSGVSVSRIYKHLGLIAQRSNVSRENLLFFPGRGNRTKGELRMMVHKLTAKALREQIKRGCTLVDFCTKYQCDSVALKAQMRKVLCNNERVVNEAFNQILANGKKQNGLKSAKSVTLEGTVAAGLIAETKNSTEIGDLTDADEETATEISAEKNDGSTEMADDILTALRQTLAGLETEAQELKVAYASADKAYSGAQAEISALEAKMAKLEKELSETDALLGNAVNKANKYFDEREQVGLLRKTNLTKQETVAAQIQELMAVQLIVYESGVIEAVDEPEFALDDTGWEKLYMAMTGDDTYENLRLKDLRLLAQVIKIRDNTVGRGVKALFDNSELQRMFDSLSPVNATPPRATSI